MLLGSVAEVGGLVVSGLIIPKQAVLFIEIRELVTIINGHWVYTPEGRALIVNFGNMIKKKKRIS